MTQSNQCLTCKHYQGAHTCKAFPFPGRIPQKIFLGLHDHTEEFEGDNGIRFEQDPDFEGITDDDDDQGDD